MRLKLDRITILRICLALITLGVIGLALQLYLRARPVGQDGQVTAAARGISESLDTYIATNQSTPATLTAVYTKPIPAAITYTRLSAVSYKFCTTYHLQTPDSSPYAQATPGTPDVAYLQVPWVHLAGKECQTVTPDALRTLCGQLDGYSWGDIAIAAVTPASGSTQASIRLASYPPATYSISPDAKVYSDGIHYEQLPFSDIRAGDTVDLYFSKKGGPVTVIAKEPFGDPGGMMH